KLLRKWQVAGIAAALGRHSVFGLRALATQRRPNIARQISGSHIRASLPGASAFLEQRTLGPGYVGDAFETILIAWLVPHSGLRDHLVYRGDRRFESAFLHGRACLGYDSISGSQ